MTDEHDTQELKLAQGEQAEHERRLAAEAQEAEAAAQHARRADKADYLRRKLEERERSEQGLED